VKLIYCPECQDVKKLQKGTRWCKCRESWGFYKEDGLNAVLGGEAVPLGFNNRSFALALRMRTGSRYQAKNFTAFTIDESVCDTIERVE
jgi:hypothetical protein